MQCIDNVFPSSVSIRWLRFPWRPVSSTLHVPSAWAPETPTAAGVSCTTCEFCLPPLPLPLLAAEGLKPRDLGSPKTACRKLPTCQSPVRACVRAWLVGFNVALRSSLFSTAVRAQQRVVIGQPDPSYTALMRGRRKPRVQQILWMFPAGRPVSERGIDLWLAAGVRAAPPDTPGTFWIWPRALHLIPS